MTARFEGKILRSTDKRPINFLSPRHRNHVDFRDPDCPLHRIYVFVSINVYIYYNLSINFQKNIYIISFFPHIISPFYLFGALLSIVPDLVVSKRVAKGKGIPSTLLQAMAGKSD